MRTHEGKARSINNQEFQQVIDTTLETSRYPERDCAILAISFYSGLRAMEIAALDFEDVLSDTGEVKQTITLRKKGTKGCKGGAAYFSNPNLRQLLSTYLVQKRSTKSTTYEPAPELRGALFTSKAGTRFSPSSMSRLFTTLYTKAGLEGCTSHTGRRSLGRNLNRNGVSLYNIQKILRHAQVQQTVAYIDVDEDLLANLVSTV